MDRKHRPKQGGEKVGCARGVGAALLKASEGLCLQRGCGLLEINVDGEDVDTRRFYEHHGYSSHEPGQAQPQLLPPQPRPGELGTGQGSCASYSRRRTRISEERPAVPPRAHCVPVAELWRGFGPVGRVLSLNA